MATMKDVLDDMFDEADRNAENSVSFIERARRLECQAVIEDIEGLLEHLMEGLCGDRDIGKLKAVRKIIANISPFCSKWSREKK